MEHNIRSYKGRYKVIQFWEIIKYAFLHQWYIFVVTFIIILIIAMTIAEPNQTLSKYFAEWKENNTGTTFNIITLVFIITVWFASIKREWQQSLNKFISVRFAYVDKDNKEQELEKLASNYAQIIDESDIRACAQSLGQVKNNNQRLPLKPSIQNLQKEIMQDCSCEINQGKPFCHFNVTIELTEDINKPKEKRPNPELTYQYSVNDDLITLQQKDNKT